MANTGATDHMLPDKAAFISYNSISNLQVQMGNNYFIPVLGRDTALSPSMVRVSSSAMPSMSPGLWCPSTVCACTSNNVAAHSMVHTRLGYLSVSQPLCSLLTRHPAVTSPMSLLVATHHWISFIISNQEAQPLSTHQKWPLPCHRHVKPPMLLRLYLP